MKINKLKVEDAIGQVLLHDLTGVFDRSSEQRNTIFKKGHTIILEDIVILKQSGKNHIYVAENLDDVVHENEVAMQFANTILNDNLDVSSIAEGKINIISKIDGLLIVDIAKVNQLNSMFDITLATKKNYDLIKKGSLVASFRIIDLFMDKDIVTNLINTLNSELFTIQNITNRRINLLTIGTEIFEDRERDLSLNILSEKLLKYNQTITNQDFLVDDLDLITKTIIEQAKISDIIFLTGGMSVDPDDFTKEAILNLADNVICNHTPYLPGSMFVLAKYKDTILVGCPANVVFAKNTVLDLFLAQIIYNELPKTKEIMELGYGALSNTI